MADAEEDSGQWMTLAELAAARRISKASAGRLVRRHKAWRRQQDNQGRVRILVPPDAIEAPDDLPDVPLDILQDSPEGSPPEMSQAISALEAAISTLREQLERSNQRADRAETRADGAEQGRDAERARADELRDQIEALRSKLAQVEAKGAASDVQAAELTAQLKQARTDAQEAAQAAEKLRQTDAEQRGRRLLARLRAALRGE
jgi:methyl-accepting chemotaxis protein